MKLLPKTAKCRRSSSRRGQGVLEFAFVSIIFIFMLILTLNMILAFCYQQYLSYAAFMAARAFQASADDPIKQADHAVRTLWRYIPDLEKVMPKSDTAGAEINHPMIFDTFRKEGVLIKKIIIPPSDRLVGSFGSIAPIEQISQLNAISIEFSVPIAQFPLSEKLGKFRFINLEARSFLGREPSIFETKAFFYRFYEQAVRGAVDSGRVPTGAEGNGLAEVMSDNGF